MVLFSGEKYEKLTEELQRHASKNVCAGCYTGGHKVCPYGLWVSAMYAVGRRGVEDAAPYWLWYPVAFAVSVATAGAEPLPYKEMPQKMFVRSVTQADTRSAPTGCGLS